MNRIVAIDGLRGFAVLGILIMNIQVFGLPHAAYFNPTAIPASANDHLVFDLIYLFADTKFMTLFSLLFGSSLALLTETQGSNGQRYIVRRHLWLAVFGFLHAYFLWAGDVLLVYAACAFLIMGLRHWTPSRQIALAAVLLTVPLAMLALGFLYTDATQEAQWQPNTQAIAQEINAMRSSWWQQTPVRIEAALEMHLELFPFFLVWRVTGLMLLGLACYRLGITTAKRTATFYQRMIVIGFLVGLPLTAAGLWFNDKLQWHYPFAATIGQMPSYIGSLFMAAAYAAIIMQWCQHWPANVVMRWLAYAGRMALSLYLMQTLIATTLFNGHGLGWFGQFSRIELLLACVIILLFQLVFARVWLSHFRYGPFEWLWRSLSKGQLS